MDSTKQLENFCTDYADKLSDVLGSSDWSGVVQIAENLQLVVGHMLMKWLYQSRVEVHGGVL